MVEIVTQFMVQTPLWVWALLACLIFRGVKARRPARTSLPKLAIIPAIFAIWSLADLTRLYGLQRGTAGPWLAGLAVGALIGWRLLAHADIRADRAAGIVERPADDTLLPLLLMTFALRYGVGALAATAPDLLFHQAFRVTDLLLSGVFTGIFIGKFTRYVRACTATGATLNP